MVNIKEEIKNVAILLYYLAIVIAIAIWILVKEGIKDLGGN